MKRLLSVFVVLIMVITMSVPVFAWYENFDIQEMIDTAEPFFRSYVESIFVDETIETDYSAFVENENLINYLEAKKDVYRLYEKYYGEVVDFEIEYFGFGSLEPVSLGQNMCAMQMICPGKNITENGVELPFVGGPVFTFIRENGELKIYDVYMHHEMEYDIRGYHVDYIPTVTKDLTDEVKAYAVEFEENLRYLVENPESIETDKSACAELALKYISDFYTELYDSEDSNGLFESDIKYENDLVKEYLEKRSYYYNTPKRYGVGKTMKDREYKVVETQYWDGVIYCEIQCLHHYVKNGGGGSHTEILAFVKNADGEYLLRDVCDSTVVDESYRGFKQIYIEMFAYIGLDSYANEELIEAIDNAQIEWNEYLAGVKAEAEEQARQKEEYWKELGKKEWANEGVFPDVIEDDPDTSLNESPEVPEDSIDNAVLLVFVIGTFALSAVAAALSFILVLKKK